MADAKRTTKPGIAKKLRPQRDGRGRFAPKVGTDVPKLSTLAQDFEQMFQSQKPHWLKRIRRWLGKKLFRTAIAVYGF